MTLLWFLLIFVVRNVSAGFLNTRIDDETETEISDWGDVKTDGIVRHIEFLIGIDSSLVGYYKNDEDRVKSATITLLHTINQYFYQLNIRLVLIDFVPVKGTNMVLLRHNYEGGISYTNGMCSENSLIISGFYPEATMNNALVLMHQIAHVIGLTHKITTNCECNEEIEPKKCLKLRGFPACSVQEMTKKLATQTCLKRGNSTNEMVRNLGSLPICGNGILEKNEDCDCGPARFCDNILCDAVRCKFVVQKSFLQNGLPMFLALFTFMILLLIWKLVCLRTYKNVRQKIAPKRSLDSENLRDIEQSPAPILAPLPTPIPQVSVVKMREPRIIDSPVPIQNRRSRFSDQIYQTMRPISRFWEKFKQPNNL
ncbi:unnamed protein product [Caenorhabditis angaria]|uniref:Peptidase M12B domain-containing protein n=1 Tax=Caenorhabditis angaria TaxID=860376 RepID=A0A9P1J411_9PELO|nr:unnamed protein product [Caenorhabditis angaria]